MDDEQVLTPDELRWGTTEWRAGATAWCDEVLGSHGITRTGEVEQPRIRMWATSLTMPTDAGVFWFKENCRGQRPEAGVVEALAAIAPDHVVPPHGVDRQRGWLLTADHGATLGTLERTDEATWRRVVTDYADLQRATVGHAARLRAAGLHPLPPQDAAGYLAGELDRLGALPAGHPRRLDDALRRRLDGLLPRAEAAGAALAAGPVPPALDHNDLHHHNAFVPVDGETTLRFFDLGDALWAHPFGSLLVTLNVLTGEWETGVDDPAVQRLVDAYLDRWTDLAPRDELRPLLRPALALARLHRYLSWDRCLSDVPADALGPWAEAPERWLEQLAVALEG